MWRPFAVVAGLLVRLRLVRGYTIWPDARWPIVAADIGSAHPAAWLRETFEGYATGRILRWSLRQAGAATTAALRARATVLGRPSGHLMRAVEAAVGRPLRKPRLALYSPSGMQISKVICFIFEAGEVGPTVAIQAMADPGLSNRLEAELDTVETVRRRLAHHPNLSTALPLQPLFTGMIDDRYLAVFPVDPLGGAAGALGGECRSAALRWLRGFHEATTSDSARAVDGREELAALGQAWSRFRPDTARATVERVRVLLAARGAVEANASFVHGDFWRGNVAVGAGGELRVFDWEWAEPLGHPVRDLIGFEIGEVRAAMDQFGDQQLDSRLTEAVALVAQELQSRQLDERAAMAMLAPTIGRIAERSRRIVNGPGDPLIRLMVATEALLGCHPCPR